MGSVKVCWGLKALMTQKGALSLNSNFGSYAPYSWDLESLDNIHVGHQNSLHRISLKISKIDKF